MKFLGYLFSLIILIPGTLSAQTPAPEPKVGTSDQIAVPKVNTEKEAKVPDKKVEDLFQATLGQDLLTANYFSLISWARDLGLDQTGGVPELRKRIAEYYKLPAAALTPAKNEPEKTVSIESAQSTEYFTIEEVDEKYVRITGNVVLNLTDKKENVTHRIQCDTLLMNQTANTVTATGNLVYTMTRGEGAKETFLGSSLTFHMDNFKGIFYDGRSNRARNVGGSDLEFTFSGDVIRRSPDDATILENGIITSSKYPDPYYRIQARKIWIMAPGEWGLLDATLFVGRVPVFYFPFFYQPGDDMFFNPVIGLGPNTERRGAFLQTTTYFMGKKKREDSPLSVLQLGGTEKDESKKVIRGWYLVKDTGKKDPSAVAIPSDWFAKLMIDGYTNLGLLGGFEFKIGNWGLLKNFSGFFGAGLTRNVYNMGGYYTPHKLTPFDPSLSVLEQDNWNKSVFLGMDLPLRYAAKLNFILDPLNIDFSMYSDPFFDGDFIDRSENFSMFSLVGFGPKKTSTTPAEKAGYSWRVSTSFTPNLPMLSPFIKSISFSNLYTDLTWDRKDQTPAKETEDPTRKFFFPASLSWPSVTASFSGDLLNLGSSAAAPGPSSTAQTLVKPWGEEKKTDSATAAGTSEKPAVNEPLRPLAPSPVTVASTGVNSSLANRLTLGYTWSNTAKQESRFDSTNWTDPRSVALDAISYSRFSLTNSGSLRLAIGLLDNFLTLDDNLSLTANSQNTWYVSQSNTPAVADSYYGADASFYRYNSANTFTLNLSPFEKIPLFQGSKATYTVTNRIIDEKMTYAAGSMTPSTLYWDWGPGGVTGHSLTSNLNVNPWGSSGLLTFNSTYSSNFYPLLYTQNLGAGANFQTPIFKMSASAGAVYNNDIWNPGTITTTQTFTPFSDLVLTNNLDWDMKNSDWSKENIRLTWLGLSLSFLAMPTTPYYFDFASKIFKQGFIDKPWNSQPVFLPMSIDAGYGLTINQARFWKDRVEVTTRLNTNWNMNIQQFTSNKLSFDMNLDIKILDFLNFAITQSTENSATYLYMPWIMDNIGGGYTTVNPLLDLWNSFSFWDEKKRKESNFKLKSLKIVATHLMKDWSVDFTYEGSFQQSTSGTTKQFQWTPTFSVFLKWKPIPEIKTNVAVDKDKNVTVKTDQ